MKPRLPLGEFTCPITFESIRPSKPVVKEAHGVTYVVQGDYEIAFETVLHFADAMELPIRARLFGEDSQTVVVRDAAGKPTSLSGYTKHRFFARWVTPDKADADLLRLASLNARPAVHSSDLLDSRPAAPPRCACIGPHC